MAINCEDIEGIDRDCTTDIGGLNQVVYINDSENVDFEAFVVDALDETYTTLALEASAPVFEAIEFRKNIASFSEAYTLAPDGAVLFTQTLVLSIHGRDASRSRKISLLAAGQRDVDIIVLDNNGQYVYMRGANLMSVADGTGTAKADGAKYTLTFTAETSRMAYFVAPTALPAVLTA
jgi:hypothetical protein